MASSKPTLRDVAQRAGVSLGTASNVINRRPNVSEDARRAVMDAVQALGYQTQPRSTTPRDGLRVIGAIGKLDDDEPMTINPFYSYVLAGIEQECRRLNISLMLTNIHVDRFNRPAALPPMLADNQVDGVLIVGTFLHDTIRLIDRQLQKHVVLVDAYAPGSSFDSVVTDNINGAYAAVDYLIRLGHTRIGLIGSVPDGYPSIRERRKGYLRALKHHRISQPYIIDGPLSRAGGYEGARQLLERSPEVTALFACNDEVALGVMQAAADLGRLIPDQLSLVGFDDIELASQVSPPLTTMRVDKILLGALAVRHLLDRSLTPNRPPLTTLIGTDLIARASVRPAR